MEFEKVYYSYFQHDINNGVSEGPDDIMYFINIGENYKIENGKMIVDDNYINGIKNEININKNINNLEELYVLYIDSHYNVNNIKEYDDDVDVELSVEEFMIKRLLE